MKYIPRLHVTSLMDGGYILNGENDTKLDEEKYKFTTGRLEAVMNFFRDEENTEYRPFKYSNWLDLPVPLSTVQAMGEAMEIEFWDDLDNESLKQLVTKCERSLVYDRLFENYLYTIGYDLTEWAILDDLDQTEILNNFRNFTNFEEF